MTSGLDVRYVRTPKRREVDSLARKAGGSAELIQVAADASDPVTEERELRALEEAGEMFPEAGETVPDAHRRRTAAERTAGCGRPAGL